MNAWIATITLLGSCVCSHSTIVINGSSQSFIYDGHGALSAGASSRLLYDYDEDTRSDILDFLFLPNFGANLHMIKVEIGGDGQSTEGTEPSHMHNRDDLSCKRPYEFWLLEEARKRNPDIKTYALSWTVPYWIGNQTGYYCQDNIDYHIKWLNCTKQYNIGNIDYIGNWNERFYGPTNWSKDFRIAMDAAGFQNTQIIIPDGHFQPQILTEMDQDPEFRDAVAGIGLHYPCDTPEPQIQTSYHKKFWSSEDYSTESDWSGAGCWGRLLNQNFIKLNVTSTIAWSLIWSVYDIGFRFFGHGLMYAFEPWSGHYTVNGPIWTHAHTGQFTQVGWKILLKESGSSGFLPNGGSYLTMAESNNANFSIILEKLEGKCLTCRGHLTQSETIQFQLTGGLERFTKLQLWSTNETHQFVEQPVIQVQNGIFSVHVERDSIYTVSSWFNGQAKGQAAIPPVKDFPLPYEDDFDEYSIDDLARFFTDDGGSFQIADATPLGRQGKVLKQWVPEPNGVNQWEPNVNPISYFGNFNWTDTTVSIDVYLEKNVGPSPPPPSPAPFPFKFFISSSTHQCMDLKGKHTENGNTVDTYPCLSQDNEVFEYDAQSGNIISKQVQDIDCAILFTLFTG